MHRANSLLKATLYWMNHLVGTKYNKWHVIVLMNTLKYNKFDSSQLLLIIINSRQCTKCVVVFMYILTLFGATHYKWSGVIDDDWYICPTIIHIYQKYIYIYVCMYRPDQNFYHGHPEWLHVESLDFPAILPVESMAEIVIMSICKMAVLSQHNKYFVSYVSVYCYFLTEYFLHWYSEISNAQTVLTGITFTWRT